ncbi:DHS-like NAD/FAD-binding domain-containing protein [Delitschia confertaspora ATCC 74209]|uniref:DHS-like NAD/FAD-binding domain-containing protein n=1 Tax=Delitschia confertaspora ATCC 74209 TaxID=1513339 RepID=A0A9P4MX98_9PLEO|nr:DHS-like NAD/FAD-binding domain-containing protein [Delitschia confertaspora ATCC 74209]
MPLLRIPYTDPLPPPKIIPPSATAFAGAVSALTNFLLAPPPPGLKHSQPAYHSHHHASPLQSRNPSAKQHGNTLLLTGAGISVPSGLADYRGTNGTYTLNKTYKPIYFHEFCQNHEARKRYWARSFLGWPSLERARANRAHEAVGRLGELGLVKRVITQNVDSFHPLTHPHLPTTELHGALRTLICLTCSTTYPRSTFQSDLARLNPSWSAFLTQLLESGALETEDPHERRRMGLKTNPDGDVDVPGVEYGTFRYPGCPVCSGGMKDHTHAVAGTSGKGKEVRVDGDGAWLPPSHSSTAHRGVLKPGVVMFGESIPTSTKHEAERAVDAADSILVIGSSLATYSAWRLVKRAKEKGSRLAILNIGGVRGEDVFFADAEMTGDIRVSWNVEEILPEIVKEVERGLVRR